MIYLTSLALILYVSGVFINKEITHVGQVLLIIPILKCLWVSFKDKTLALPKSAYWLIGFIFMAFLSIWLNSDLIERPSKLWYNLRAPMLSVLLIYVFRYWLKEANDQVKKMTLNAFFLALIISSLYGIYCFIVLGQNRLEGFIHIMKQGYGSALILSALIPAILHHKKIQSFFSMKFATFTAVIVFITLILTFTRGAMIGLICSIPLTLFFYKHKWGYIAGTISLAVIVGGIGYYFSNPQAISRFKSDKVRFNIVKAGIYGVVDRPLKGWGYMNFENYINFVKSNHGIPKNENMKYHTHNNFLEVAVGTGLFGLITFLGWLIAWAIEMFNNKGIVKILSLPVIIVFVISGQFELTLDHRLAIITFLFYAIMSTFSKKNANAF